MWVGGWSLGGKVWELLRDQLGVLLSGGGNIPRELGGGDGWLEGRLLVVVAVGDWGGQLRWWASAELAPAEGLGVRLFGLLLARLLPGATFRGRRCCSRLGLLWLKREAGRRFGGCHWE